MPRPKIILETAWTPQIVQDTLRRETDQDGSPWTSVLGTPGDRPLIAKIDGERFRLRKRARIHNDFAAQFFGRVIPAPRGATIEGYFDYPRWVRHFMRAWLALAILIAVPIFALTLMQILRQGHWVNGDMWVGLVVPPIFLLYALLLPKVGRWIGRGGEQYILQFMKTALAARVTDS